MSLEFLDSAPLKSRHCLPMYLPLGPSMKLEQAIACEPEQLEDWLPIMEVATREVFTQMVSTQLNVPERPSAAISSVTAMIGLAGLLTGVMSLRCEDEAAALITSRMLGINLEEANSSIADAMGEVCNMVAGNFKHKIPGLGDGCLLSLPSVVRGGDYTIHARPNTPRIHLHFLIENMPIMISLYVAGRTAAKL